MEYRIPFALLRKFSNVTQPENGAIWRANFYKIAENNSNPHYITWNRIENHVPDFHLPNYFGRINFC
jgi:ribosomal protein S8E